MINKNRATVYAWKMNEGLCSWAAPSKFRLQDESMPSPEAKIVKCIMLTYSEYLKLKRGVR